MVNLTPGELAALERAALAEGESLGGYVRRVLLRHLGVPRSKEDVQ
jgi:hypothetical protein